MNLKYWYYKNYKLFENINIVQGETNIERLKNIILTKNYAKDIANLRPNYASTMVNHFYIFLL